MNPALEAIPERILHLALGALTQANMHAVFQDAGNEHWEYMSVLNAAHAGELFLKAIIANEHPLLIFKDLFGLDDGGNDQVEIRDLVERGKTHDFDKLPQVLWVTTGRRVPNMVCFDRLRRARNAVQHFCAPERENLQRLSLEFIYTVIDPLIADAFELCAIEYHEDHAVGYDYVVARLLREELKFTVPTDFRVPEIRLREFFDDASEGYRSWLEGELARIGKLDLLN